MAALLASLVWGHRAVIISSAMGWFQGALMLKQVTGLR